MNGQNNKIPRVRSGPGRPARRSLREVLHLTLHSRGSPEAIARGFAIGLIIAFSPTFGFQVLLALFLATLFRANRPAAVLSVFVTNIATMVPIYGFTYRIGTWFLPGRSPEKVRVILGRIVARLRQHEFYQIHNQIREIIEISKEFSKDVFWPMAVGGLIVGLLVAAISYPLTLWVIRRIRRRRKHRLNTHFRRHRTAPAKSSGSCGEPRLPPTPPAV
ncbi:MAG: DUF2062 domain-containing protein [Kiritimatiellia bacterium]|nr:DUF2062 domain-containing protein [Kiritimatiellia bacterium]